MHIRDATLSDIPCLVEIWLIAFRTEPDYKVTFPWRNEFPDDYKRLWTTRFTAAFLEAEERYLVVETAVVDGNGVSRLEITGWTSWTRKGSSQAAEKIRADNNSFLKGFERRLHGIQETLVFPVLRFLQLYPEGREEGPVAIKYYKEHDIFSQRFWTGDLEEHWLMKRLTVDPKWQRRGIGMMLLQWGLDRAQEEGIPVGLESTAMGSALYIKAGFVEIERYGMKEVGIDFPILLWRPKMAGV